MSARFRSRNIRPSRAAAVQREIRRLPDIAYYIQTTDAVNPNAALPLTEAFISSENITMLNNYVFNLNNGIYRLGFSAAAKALEDASEVGLGFFVNGCSTNIATKNSSIKDNTYALSAEGIIVSTSNNTKITLVNAGNVITSYAFVNVIAERIN